MFDIKPYADFIRATLRLATPLLLSSLGGSFMHQVGKPNVAIEGMMLTGAMAAYVGSMMTGSSIAGLAAAILIGVVIAIIYAFFSLKLEIDVFAIGFTIVIFCTGVTAFILRNVFGQEGVLVSSGLTMLPKISFSAMGNKPIFDALFNNYSLLIPVAFLLVAVVHVIFYHTPYGYWIRASGRKPAALEASGRNPKLVQFSAFVISGVLCGVAGAHLSIGYLSLFALSIIAGRGFIALAIIFFANAKPSVILGASIIFGAAEALTPRIPVEVMPPQASLMLPYIITILTITFFGAQKRQE